MMSKLTVDFGCLCTVSECRLLAQLPFVIVSAKSTTDDDAVYGAHDFAAGRLDTSERTLRRRSQDLFGYGPKTLHRILRLQRFVASVRRFGVPGLADGAYASGYADQAHLNREIQSLCAMTAGELTRQLAA